MADFDMPVASHLAELRKVLIRASVALVVAFCATWAVHTQIFEFLAEPVMRGLAPHGIDRLQALQVTEGIVVHMKAAGVAAVLLASPYLIWLVWRFVSPALMITEKRMVALTGGMVVLFFGLGVLFSYTIFVPLVVDFLAGFGLESGSLVLNPTLENTFGMAMFFMVMFGAIFELPLIMLVLGALHAVRPGAMLRGSRWFIVGAFIVAAIFTPPEPVSQTLMAVPMCLLYMLGILLAWAGWRMGGENGTRRAFIAAGAAVVLFAAGVVVASWQWNEAHASTTDVRTSKPAGESSVSFSLDAPCARAASGWKLGDGERLNVTVTRAAGGVVPVVFQADRGTTLNAGKGRAGPIGAFFEANARSAWSSDGNGHPALMLMVTAADAGRFARELMQWTDVHCPGNER